MSVCTGRVFKYRNFNKVRMRSAVYQIYGKDGKGEI